MRTYQQRAVSSGRCKEDKREEREGKSHSHLDQGKGKSHSDRSQVIGGKLLIGKLAPWVTWGYLAGFPIPISLFSLSFDPWF